MNWLNLQFEHGLELLKDPERWWQLALLLLATACAFAVNKIWRNYLDNRLGDGVARDISSVALRITQRITLPMVMLIVIVAGQAVLELLNLPHRLVDIAIAPVIALAAIRFLVYVLQRTFRPTPSLRAWENVISSIAWVLVALYLIGWLPAIVDALDSIAINVGDARVSILSAAKLSFAICMFMVIALWMAKAVERKVKKSDFLSSGVQEGIIKFAKFFLIMVSLVFALSSVGIDLTALAVFGGALGVGIGFGLQKIASNFISGFILVLDRSIRPGDVITIGSSYGWVQQMAARYVVVKDRGGVERLIPNETLITSEVINWSFSDKKVRLKLPVLISYTDDPELAMKLLVDAADHPRILESPKAGARLMEFADSGIQLELRFWIQDPQEGVNNVRSDVNRSIWREFKKAGITIPFPQREVRVIGSPIDPGLSS